MSENFQSDKSSQEIRASLEYYMNTKGMSVDIPRGSIPGELTIEQELEATGEKAIDTPGTQEAKPNQS